jgi:hypothetical protein
MSITEIASTGLLRVIALPPEDASRGEVPDWTARAMALASLEGVGGVPASVVNLPSRAVRPPERKRKTAFRPRDGKGSGDYRARAKGQRGGTGMDDDAPSTFSSLL